MKDIIRMNQLAGIITEGQARKMMQILTEETFYQKIQSLNPGYSKENVLDFVKDEYEKPEDWANTNIDVSGDYAEHQEYLKGVNQFFDRIESTGPTVTVGDLVKVFMKSDRKWGIGKITSETSMAGNYMFAGSVEPKKVPAWEIDCYTERDLGSEKTITHNGKTYYFIGTVYYPQYNEGKDFMPL